MVLVLELKRTTFPGLVARATGFVAATMVASAAAFAADNMVTINGGAGSKLQTINIGGDMSFQCFHRTVPGQGQIFPTSATGLADMGIFARIGTTLVAPDFPTHLGGSATGGLGSPTRWTFVSFSGLTGNGSLGSPFTYTVAATGGGLRLDTTVTYVNNENFFRHTMKFTNTTGAPLTFDAFVASDIFLAGSDSGIPLRIATTGCVGGSDCGAGTYKILHIPITPADHYTATSFGSVWSQIGAGDLNDFVGVGCQDNGAGLEWKGRTLGAGESLKLYSATSFGDVPAIATVHTGVNKDLINATGSSADEVAILVNGNYPVVKSHFDGGFPNFSITAGTSQTLFRWWGMTVPNNGLVHVGVEVYGPNIEFMSIAWLDNGVRVGCARQVNTLYGTHTSGTHQVTYNNSILQCEATPLHTGELTVEYYVTPPALAELNPNGNRSPIAVDVITDAPLSIAPGASASVFIPDPPAGAQFAMLDFKVSTNPSLAGDVTHDFVLLGVDTAIPSLPPVSFCTAGTTTHGCQALMSATANPSLLASPPCTISVSGVEGQKQAVLFYGINNSGFSPLPWGLGSSSFLCVKPPTQRCVGVSTGGSVSQCDGSVSFDWDTYQLAHPSSLGQPWAVGNKVYVQLWFRDPPAPKTTNLSDALELTYQP